MREEADAVWMETQDGPILQQLFGFVPTLHDAVIRELAYDRARDELAMVLDYRDSVEAGGGSELKVRIRLEWKEVRSISLPLHDESLMGLELKRGKGSIETTLEFLGGIIGTIVSGGFEAILVQVAPGDDDAPAWLRLA